MFLEDEPDDDDISVHEDELERDGPQEESRLYRLAGYITLLSEFLLEVLLETNASCFGFLILFMAFLFCLFVLWPLEYFGFISCF